MKKTILSSLSVAALAMMAPVAGVAQSYYCQPGQTLAYIGNPPQPVCYVNALQAPEISTSASVGGMALLLCGAVMLRRKQVKTVPVL